MKPAVRWAMVVGLLAFALVVALWPRADPTTPVSAGAAPPASSLTSLDALRARAALQPCPAGTPSVTIPSVTIPSVTIPSVTIPSATPAHGPLSGLVLPCLGQPGTVDVGAALAGRPALLNLWGPLCQPCAQELPALAAYAAGPHAIPVFGVEVQRLPEGALEMLAALNVRYPSLSDPDGRLRAALDAPAVLPLSFVVSADGRVSQVNPPEVLRSPEQVRTIVARYLGPGAVG